jgi:hypothetical protein
MPTREQGLRRVAVVTGALVAASAVGSLAVAGIAYTQTQAHTNAATNTTNDYPTVSNTSGDTHATSNGS